MLALTAGLGVYGIVFSRTLDRDLVAGVQYRMGADLMVRPLWEFDEFATGGFEDPEYREPPYSAFAGLPGVAATARVQHRPGVTLLAGNRSLGQIVAMGILPREFYDTPVFRPGLLPAPPAVYLNLLASDERAAILSRDLAVRHGVRAGDVIRLIQEGYEVSLQVVGVVTYCPVASRWMGASSSPTCRISRMSSACARTMFGSASKRERAGTKYKPLCEQATCRSCPLSTAGPTWLWPGGILFAWACMRRSPSAS